MAKSLAGKVAIVTGAARGIGHGIALELGTRGASVLITYVSPSSKAKAESLAEEIKSKGGKAATLQADCAAVESPKAVVDAAVKEFDGGIDIIVNNAGTCEEIYLEDIDIGHFDRIITTNLRFPLFLMQQSLPYLRRGGRIVNLASVAAREGP